MLCEKCGKDRHTGSTYSFFYGTMGFPETRDYTPMYRVVSTRYTIAGQASAWICDSCVGRALLPQIVPGLVGLLLGGLLIGVFILALGKFTDIKVLVGILVFALLCMATGILVTFMRKQEYGERAAIGVRTKELRSQGYNAFLTSNEHKKMRKY